MNSADRYSTECKESKACAPFKHHFDECVERVTSAEEGENKGPHEDCVEECKYFSYGNEIQHPSAASPVHPRLQWLTGDLYSLPSRPLCEPMRRTEGVCCTQVGITYKYRNNAANREVVDEIGDGLVRAQRATCTEISLRIAWSIVTHIIFPIMPVLVCNIGKSNRRSCSMNIWHLTGACTVWH